MDPEKGARNPTSTHLNNSTTRPTTRVMARGERPKVGGEHTDTGISVQLVRDKTWFQLLNSKDRNAIAHEIPGLIRYAKTEGFQRRAIQRGLHKDKDCVVRWKPSAIPFLVEFKISVSGNRCQHLVSVKKLTASDLNEYARKLAPLARAFLSKPPGSYLPHLPFTRPQIPGDNRLDQSAEDKRIKETVQHAHLINDQNNSLSDIDINTAEVTARMGNAGKILPGLLIYLTSSEHRTEGSELSTEPQKTKSKRLQPKKGPLQTAPRRLGVPTTMHELQNPEPVLEHKRVVSCPENDVKGRVVTANPTQEESSTPEDTTAVEKCLPDESAATNGSSKRKKASKKKHLGRKQFVKEQNRHKALSAVSAYPTQRPPRKKRAKKPTNIKESLQEQKLELGEHDSEQVPMARSSPPEGSDHDDHGGKAREQGLIYGEPIIRDFAYPIPSLERHEESYFHTPEEAFDQERFPADASLYSHDVFNDEEPAELLSDGDDESTYYTPEESFDQEWIEADVKLHSSDISDEQESGKSSDEYAESMYHTPREYFDQEGIATDVEMPPSDILHGEDLPTTTVDSAALNVERQPIVPGTGARGLLWAYTINENVNFALYDAGIYLWEKPNTYFCAKRLLRTVNFGHSALAPVIVSHQRTGSDEPIIEFDGNTVHIVPHGQCWEDVRSEVSHPDFLIPWKLVEYQACEAVGYRIWRHDRDLLRCRRPGCRATVSDYHRSAVVCLGCGPKSVVRYCSLQHQLEDIRGHWKECGTWKMVLQRVIDHTTAPKKFARMFPMIKQRHGSISAELYRQRLYCTLTYGHYTLFHPASKSSKTLCWSKQDPKWPEMDRRVERLLNIAFFDSWNHIILGYLYRLLRELLRSQGEWYESTERLLKRQFELEFSSYKVNTNWNNSEAPCPCEWSGKIVPRWDHSSTCWAYAPEEDDNGSAPHRRCVGEFVEEYEARFWILRAWRQQHPLQNNWRLRAAGYGFPKTVPDEECYKLGAGWTGWGGEMDNIRGFPKDQGESYSVRSV